MATAHQIGPMRVGDLANELGTTPSHIAYACRDGHRIQQRWRIERKSDDVGGKLYTAIDVAEPADDAPADDVSATPMDEASTPAQSEPIDTAPIHGRTLNALIAAEIKTAADLEQYVADLTREEAADKISGVPGVGKKGAADAVEWLISTGWKPKRGEVRTFADLEIGEEFPAETRSGRFTFRAIEPGHHDDTGSPYNAEWVDGPTPGARCYFTSQFQLIEFSDDAEHEFSIEEQGEPPATASGDIEIRCPHCNGLFDEAPLGAYESGEASCHDDDGQGTRGDCGEKFQLVATPTGYETHKIATQDRPLPADATASGDVGSPEAPPSPAEEAEELASTDAQEAPAAPFHPVSTAEPAHSMLPHCRALGTAPAHSDEWLALRAQGIGSSDAGAILGVNPLASIVDAWASKVGRAADDVPWLQVYAEFGTWFEAHLLDWCRRDSGRDLVAGADVGTLQSAALPWLLANIDGFDPADGTLDELKTTESEWESVPESHFAQVQHQMAVTGAPEARIRQFISPIPRDKIASLRSVFHEMYPFPFEEDGDARLAAWLLAEGKVVTWVVARNESYIERMIARHTEFWRHVEACTEPPIHDPEGTANLTDDPDVFVALSEWAQMKAANIIYKPELKREDELRKAARKAIERAVSLLGHSPKRIVAGEHKATYVQKSTHAYWDVYAGDIDDIEI